MYYNWIFLQEVGLFGLFLKFLQFDFPLDSSYHFRCHLQFLLWQIQGNREHFEDTCGGPIGWLSSKTYYTAFLEGWGLYAENPLISDDTDVYDGRPLKKYGMLKWQVGNDDNQEKDKMIVEVEIAHG